jgi:hypothetical protein
MLKRGLEFQVEVLSLYPETKCDSFQERRYLTPKVPFSLKAKY